MLLAVAQVAVAQKPVKVQGVVEGSKADAKLCIFLEESIGSGMFAAECDTIVVKKGKFSYTKQIDCVTKAWLGRGEEQGIMPCNVFLVPGETLKLTLKDDEVVFGGSRIYKEYNEARTLIYPLEQESATYFRHALLYLDELHKKQVPEDEIEALSQKMGDSLSVKTQAYLQAARERLASHKDVEGTILCLVDVLNTMEIYDKMGDEVKAGRVGQYLKASVDILAEQRARQEKEAAEELAKMDSLAGTPAKDFTLKDLDGNDFTLSSLRGKYVVLDFWGSWCGWCIKGIPEMKKYYEKYAGKFEILGIDCNDSEKAWRKAVKDHGLPWLHVYNPSTSTLLEDYFVQGFPTKIVVDPNGNIAKVIVGESPAFYEYLDELLK